VSQAEILRHAGCCASAEFFLFWGLRGRGALLSGWQCCAAIETTGREQARGAVPFSCTECGKCCQVRGDVWASPDDSVRLAEHLGMADVQALGEKYGKMEVEGWIQMKDKPEGGCIFLADDGKTCGVYEGRPLQVLLLSRYYTFGLEEGVFDRWFSQCRVYPFFPRILKTPEAWNGEVVDAPDAAAPAAGRVWSADTGGCEGMGQVKGEESRSLSSFLGGAGASPGGAWWWCVSGGRVRSMLADAMASERGQAPTPPGGGWRGRLGRAAAHANFPAMGAAGA